MSQEAPPLRSAAFKAQAGGPTTLHPICPQPWPVGVQGRGEAWGGVWGEGPASTV